MADQVKWQEVDQTKKALETAAADSRAFRFTSQHYF
jgi:hypothetical protein